MAQRWSRPETKRGRPFESGLIGRDGKKEGGETALWLLVRVTEHVVLNGSREERERRELYKEGFRRELQVAEIARRAVEIVEMVDTLMKMR